ncbi:ABC transporter ATP-binding protein [Desulforhopalus sp. 52FAK]
MSNVLEIKALTKKFGDFVAVDGVDIEVEEGSFFSILGPSGCGKTTLLRMISGFLEPDSGTLRIRGENMLGVPPNKRPVNLVFQNLALFPMMNVAGNIAFGLKRQRKSAKEIDHKIDSILERVGLSGYKNSEVSQLSGGQKQRVAIARSLVLDPSILLLDEPLGALDLKLREQMKIELKKLQAEVGTTFIYITHDQSEALVMSDNVAVMNCGRFEQIDSPRNLYSDPETAFVAGFVGENNAFEVQVVSGRDPFTVQTAMGQEIQGVAVGDIRDKCTLYIRPEAIILSPPEDTEGLNLFDIEVRNILFDGSNTKILATLIGSEVELSIALPQNQQFAHIQVGDTLQAGVHFSSCKCYGAANTGDGHEKA